MTPYSISVTAKKTKRGAGTSEDSEELIYGENDQSQAADSDEDDKDDITADAMIKVRLAESVRITL